jgi:hypothetical protein
MIDLSKVYQQENRTPKQEDKLARYRNQEDNKIIPKLASPCDHSSTPKLWPPKQKESHFFFKQANWVQGRKGRKMCAHI